MSNTASPFGFTPTSGTGVPTPVPSSPPASESFFSEMDGTASVLDTSFGDLGWEPPADASSLNIVSWKLGVDAHVDDGVDKRGFNAISTVLAHPTKRANPLRASRKPLPPLSQPLPILPKPHPPSHYDAYLKSIAPLYETFVQSQAAVKAASGTAHPSEIDLQAKNAAKADLPSLDDIPSFFFNSNFDIANPSTWAEVMDSAGAMSKSDTRDGAVQDTLSTHLDNLERHLVHEITLRSASFFSALSNLQDLSSESASCLARISDLKSSLTQVGSKQAKRGLEIIDAQAQLRTLRVTEGGIKRIAELDELLRIAKSLADGGDWEGALGCVEDVVKWWERNSGQEGESSTSPLPLTSLPALGNLPTVIAFLTSNIAGQLEGVLSSVLQSVLSEADEGKEFDPESLRAAVGPMLGGLIRCGRLDTLGGVWRGAVTTSIREALRQHLPLSQSESEPADVDAKITEVKGGEARGQALTQALQSLDHADFVKLSQKMYRSMLARLQLSQKMGEDMAAFLRENRSLPALGVQSPNVGSGPPLPAKTPEPPFNPADVLTSACELANNRASIILSVRGEQHAALTLEQFVEIFGESWKFVVESETLAKRMIVALRGVAASQARNFLVAYHGQRLQQSARLVEEETWVQVDVRQQVQETVDRLVRAAVSDPGECFIPPRPSNGDSNGAATNGDAKPSAKILIIEDQPFFVVKATAESLVLLGDYLSIVVNLELVVTDVMSRIIEFLKSFNSRTCQVVLGAGAMRSAGLRNITAKHLALASQSLSVVISLISYVREFIRRHLNPKQAVMLIEFDKLKRDYQEHQNEIHSKLVAIMADRLAVHCGEFRQIDWDTTPPGPPTANQYALMLTKETATLHKVLSKYLSHATVERVMSQVLAASVHRLTEEYARVELKTEDAKKRMLNDAQVIVARLTPLSESSSATTASLETLVREKLVPRRNVGETVRGMLGRGSNAAAEANAATEGAAAAEDTPAENGTPSALTEEPAEEKRVSLDRPAQESAPERVSIEHQRSSLERSVSASTLPVTMVSASPATVERKRSGRLSLEQRMSSAVEKLTSGDRRTSFGSPSPSQHGSPAVAQVAKLPPPPETPTKSAPSPPAPEIPSKSPPPPEAPIKSPPPELPVKEDTVAVALEAPSVEAGSAAKEDTQAPVAEEEAPAPVAKEEAPAPVDKEEAPEALVKETSPEPEAKDEAPESIVDEVPPPPAEKNVVPEPAADAPPEPVATEVAPTPVAEKPTEDADAASAAALVDTPAESDDELKIEDAEEEKAEDIAEPVAATTGMSKSAKKRAKKAKAAKAKAEAAAENA